MKKKNIVKTAKIIALASAFVVMLESLFLIFFISFNLFSISLFVISLILVFSIFLLVNSSDKKEIDPVLQAHLKRKNREIHELEEKNQLLIKSSLRTAERASELSQKIQTIVDKKQE